MNVTCLKFDPPTKDKRRAMRFAITLPVLLHYAGKKYAATIANIGEGGVMLASSLRCSVGEAVVIRCGAADVLAIVAWRRDSLLGLSFTRRLPASEVAEHLCRSRAVADRRKNRLTGLPPGTLRG